VESGPRIGQVGSAKDNHHKNCNPAHHNDIALTSEHNKLDLLSELLISTFKDKSNGNSENDTEVLWVIDWTLECDRACIFARSRLILVTYLDLGTMNSQAVTLHMSQTILHSFSIGIFCCVHH
jgi:hypothetical protein